MADHRLRRAWWALSDLWRKSGDDELAVCSECRITPLAPGEGIRASSGGRVCSPECASDDQASYSW